MKVIAVNFKRLKKYNKAIMKICNKETQSTKKEVTTEFVTLKNRNLLYIGREMIINLYNCTVLFYLKPLKLKICKGNNI